MLLFTLTFLIVGGMTAGYSLRIVRLEAEYAATQGRIDELVSALNRERQWSASVQEDAIKHQVYALRTTRAFSGD